MPALPTVTKTIKVALGFDLDLGSGGSRFFVSYTGGTPTVADLNSFASAVSGAWGTHMKSLQCSAFSLNQVTCEDLNTTSGNLGSWGGSVAGTSSDVYLAASTCAVIDMKISRRYRGGKPRLYLPIGVWGDTDGAQVWGTTFQTNVDSQFPAFIAEVVGESYASFSASELVNVSYYSGVNTSTPPWRGPGYKYPPKVRTGPITPDEIVSVGIRPTIGSQRRRLTTA